MFFQLGWTSSSMVCGIICPQDYIYHAPSRQCSSWLVLLQTLSLLKSCLDLWNQSGLARSLSGLMETAETKNNHGLGMILPTSVLPLETLPNDTLLTQSPLPLSAPVGRSWEMMTQKVMIVGWDMKQQSNKKTNGKSNNINSESIQKRGWFKPSEWEIIEITSNVR